MTGQTFYLSFDCPACGKQWGESARVRRDAPCPRCGVVSLYTRARAVDPWPWPTARAPQRPYPPATPDPARDAAACAAPDCAAPAMETGPLCHACQADVMPGPDPARAAAEARWHFHDETDTIDLY